jgi:predicted RND superfamily exporter protein
MNKIVREHYPVEKLPADLRSELGLAQTVTVTIEAEERSQPRDPRVRQAIEKLRAHRARAPVSPSDAVERVSRLRDEWDR